MQTNYNVTTPNTMPSFRAIYYDSAKDTLCNVLNCEQLKEFRNICKQYEAHKFGDIELLGDGKKLSANVVVKTKLRDGTLLGGVSEHKQSLLESPMRFVKRMCKIVDKRTQDLKITLEKLRLLS